MTHKPGTVNRHIAEMWANSSSWERKPVLRKVYRRLHRQIAQRVAKAPRGLVVELGSGLGKLGEVLPECILTDMVETPWVKQVENAYRMSFDSGTVAVLILIDVFHHLEYPGMALREFRRVLIPGGRLIILEPAMSFISVAVMGIFHKEPLGLTGRIEWDPPVEFDCRKVSYYARQSAATRVFLRGFFKTELKGWRRDEASYLSALAYLGTGGFSGPQVYPDWALGVIERIDAVLLRWPRIFASRLLIVMTKMDHDGNA